MATQSQASAQVAASPVQRSEQKTAVDDVVPKQPVRPAADQKKVLAFLRGKLDSASWKRIAASEVAQGTGMSQARAEAALAALVTNKKGSSKGRGLYRLPG